MPIRLECSQQVREVGYPCVVVELKGEVICVVHQHIDLRQDVDVGQLQLHHGGEGKQHRRYVAVHIHTEGGVYQVHRHQAEVKHLHQLLGDFGHDLVMRVELDLPRAVEDHIGHRVAGSGIPDPGDEPIQVDLYVLHRVDQAAIRPELELCHDILHIHQLPNVDITLIGEVVIGGIQVHQDTRALQRIQQHLHAGAIRRLARARGAQHQLSEENHGSRASSGTALIGWQVGTVSSWYMGCPAPPCPPL
mmetsp:Transcript_127455/g.285052  ORF Transcript_127455/g.285052 Transcript_127455/m.285052 type:complete len:248 (-) Transcript_127455:34-777(-)